MMPRQATVTFVFPDGNCQNYLVHPGPHDNQYSMVQLAARDLTLAHQRGDSTYSHRDLMDCFCHVYEHHEVISEEHWKSQYMTAVEG